MRRQQIAAVVALVVGAATVVLAAAVAVVPVTAGGRLSIGPRNVHNATLAGLPERSRALVMVTVYCGP